MMTAVVLCLFGAAELSTSTPAPRAADQGGVIAPAVLPRGSLAFFALVGAPEVGVGYRQGFGPVELQATALFDQFELSVSGELGVRVGVWRTERFQLGVGAAFGLKANSGSTAFHDTNLAFFALRPHLCATFSYAATPFLSVISQLDLPLAIALTMGATQVTPAVGGGLELTTGSPFSLLVMGLVGADVLTGPDGASAVRASWAVRLGVGYRAF